MKLDKLFFVCLSLLGVLVFTVVLTRIPVMLRLWPLFVVLFVVYLFIMVVKLSTPRKSQGENADE